MGDNNSIVNVDAKGLSKVGTKLVEKVADGIGAAFAPTQVVRMARAQAKADLITAQAQIDVDELQKRAMQRFVAEEAQKQSNIEEITKQAIPLLEDKSEPEKMDDDWVANFFDKSRIVSDKEMQSLWSKVLAGEANQPGKYSKRTVNLISDLDKSDAELFAKLGGFSWMVGSLVPLIFDFKDSIYKDNGIDFGKISHLDTLGLIQFNNITGFQRTGVPQKFAINYYGKPLILERPEGSKDQVDIGHCLLTKAGLQLIEICGSKPVEGFFEYVTKKYQELNFIPRQEVPS